MLPLGGHKTENPNTPSVTSAPHQLSTINLNLTQTQTRIEGAQKMLTRIERKREKERGRERSGNLVAGIETQMKGCRSRNRMWGARNRRKPNGFPLTRMLTRAWLPWPNANNVI